MKKLSLKNILCKLGLHQKESIEAVGEVNWVPFYYTKTQCKNCKKRFFK